MVDKEIQLHEHRSVDYACGCAWERYSPDGVTWSVWKGFLCRTHQEDQDEDDPNLTFLKGREE